MKFLLGLFIFLLTFKAEALMEPYLYFSDEEMGTVNGPLNITPEYYSDYRTFQQPFYLHDKFLKSENAFDLAVGSITGKRFLSQKRLKLKQAITERLTFKLHFVEIENFEQRRRNLNFGLGYKLNSWLELNAYGSLFFEKEKNDIGFSLDFALSKNHELKFFINLPDYQFTKRNLEQAKDLDSLLSYGLYGVYHYSEKSFFEYHVHQQDQLRRLYTTEDRMYSFKEFRAGVKVRHQLEEDWFLNFDINWVDSAEGENSPNQTLTGLQSWSRDSVRFNVQSEWSGWVLGLEANYRYWLNEDSQAVMHKNFLPYLWKKIRHESFEGLMLTSIDIGLDAVNHWSRGDLSLRDSFDQENKRIDSRLNVRLSFDFSKNTNLILILSGDIDDPSWEGGGGQFQMLF